MDITAKTISSRVVLHTDSIGTTYQEGRPEQLLVVQCRITANTISS